MQLERDSSRWILLDSIDSTNQYAMTHKDLPSGTVVLAGEQTAGRGRMGRSWQSVPGNSFLFSGIFEVNRSDPQFPFLHLFSQVCGLSLLRACRSFSEERISLKWPNDLYLERSGSTGKLAGILLETDALSSEKLRCVLGIGLNWKGTSPEIQEDMPSISLFEASSRDVHELVLPFIQQWNDLTGRLPADHEEILSEIRKNFYLDQKIISLSGKLYRAAGMDEEGGLILESLDDGRIRILNDTSEKMRIVPAAAEAVE